MAISVIGGAGSAVPTLNKQVFTTSGSFIKPAGVKKITVTACGGGASYGSQTNYNTGATGGFIEYEYDISSKADGASIPIVVGAGGTGIAGSGGNTVIDNLIYASGAISAEAVQPDSGVLSNSGTDYLKLTDVSDIDTSGPANFYHADYKFKLPRYVNSSSTFGSIVTVKPDGTRYVFTPTTPGTHNDIFYYSFQGDGNFFGGRPNIATDGNGTIVITGFYRPSTYTSEVTVASIVTTNHGQTWALLDMAPVRTALNINTSTPVIFVYNNNNWLVYQFSSSSVETGTVMAVSSNLSTWSPVGSGKFNAAAANNAGGVPYGGIRILSAYYDIANSVWLVARWSRNGFYAHRVFIEKSSGPDLATATWTTLFYDEYGNGSDTVDSRWYATSGSSTIAKKSNGTYVHAFLFIVSNQWYFWEFGWNSLSATSANGGSQQQQMVMNGSGVTFFCGFSPSRQAFVYFASGAQTTNVTQFFVYGLNVPFEEIGIFLAAFNNSFRYIYLGISGTYETGDRSHYLTYTSGYAITALRKAIVAFGSRPLPLGSVGFGGYGGIIKRIGFGNSTTAFSEPEKHPDKFAPAQYNDGANVWFVYDQTWPGAGGYYLTTPVGRWKTRNGNNGQVIIRWTA
jgi:hypothetical protein